MDSVLVLMSSFNGEKYLREQIDSILSQKGCIVDLLIRDDGSTDITHEILIQYAQIPNVTWYEGENLRSAKSFIHLLANCPKQYDYFAFSDQDDVWDNDKLSCAIEKIKGIEGKVLYCSNALLVNKELYSLHQYVYKHSPEFSLERVLVAGEIQGATIVMNRALVEAMHLKEIPEYVPMHDYYVGVICAALGGIIVFDKESHMKYRQHDNNVLGVSTSFGGKLKRNLNRVLHQGTFVDVEKISMELLKVYIAELPENSRKILELAKDHKAHFHKRVRFVMLKGMKFGKINQEITYKLAIIFGRL